MADPAHEDAERVIKGIERRLAREYSQAAKEVQAKLDDYLARFKKKDGTWREWVEKAEADPQEYAKRQEEYRQWRVGQVAVGKRWRALKEELADGLHNVNEAAREIARRRMPEIYAENHNYATYEAETGARLDTGYTLYDRDTVARLMRDDPQLLPDPGKKTSERIRAGLDKRWNKRQIQSVMMQGILQGESIPDLATRLAKEVGDKNRKAAIRNARTMATGAENAGRTDGYKRARSLGIDMEQEWLATLDGRTRHSHRAMDHERRPVGEAFSNGCRYPGDPTGPAAEVYCCRCSLRGIVAGLEPQARKFRDLSDIGGDYEAWKAGRTKAESNPITLPEEKGEAIRRGYVAEYGRKAASPVLGRDR